MKKRNSIIAILCSILILLSACSNNVTSNSEDSTADTRDSDEAMIVTAEQVETAEAEEPYISSPEEDFLFSIDNGAATINRYIGSDEEVFIPQTLDGVPVTGIGKAFWSSDTVVSVVIPEGIENIADNAFSFCTNLSSVQFPQSLKNIGRQAFLSCRRLSQCALPDQVTLGVGAFTDTPFLKDQKLLVHGGVVYDCDLNAERVEIPEGVTAIADNAFNGCNKLTEVIIPEGVTSIGDYAFLGCTALKKVGIPSTAEYIGKSCFRYCRALEHAVLPDGLKKIEENTFLSCNSLSELIIPDSVTEIGESAFASTKLKTVDLPEGLTEIGDMAFAGTDIVSITVPAGVTSCRSQFNACSELEDVIFLGDIEEIGDFCFARDFALKSVTVGSLKKCSTNAFYDTRDNVIIKCGDAEYSSVSAFMNEYAVLDEETVEIGGIRITEKAYENAVQFNDSLNENWQEINKVFEVSERDKQKFFFHNIYNKVWLSIYDYDHGPMCRSATGVLVYGKAVCEGKAEAMKVLCELAGIECEVIREYWMNHAWVKVKLDGSWYNCDPTNSLKLFTDKWIRDYLLHYTGNAWDYSAYPDILTSDTIDKDLDKTEFTDSNGITVSCYYYKDDVLYSPYYDVRETVYNTIIINNLTDGDTVVNDKRFQYINAVRVEDISTEQLEKLASKTDYVSVDKLICDNVTDLVLPYNVVNLDHIENNPILETITYPPAISKLFLGFDDLPKLSDVWLPNMLREISNERSLKNSDLNIVIHYHGKEYSDYESLFEQIHANSKEALGTD